jgi:hypothetical protein
MLAQVKVRDELIFNIGRPPVEFVVDMPSERVSIREFIRARVEQEVAGYNAQQGEYFHGLVQPGDAELTLNGYRMPRRHRIDATTQVQQALAAFERNGFLILVDDRQVEQLDDVIVLGPETVVTFLKLIPLVGG